MTSKLFKTLNDAIGLANRFTEAETFRSHVMHRLRLVVPMCLLILFVGVACAAGVMLALGEIHRSLVLVGVILMPLVLIGGVFVLAYLFFSWLENRALAHGEAARGLHGLPAVPWLLATAVLFVPLGLLAVADWKAALAARSRSAARRRNSAGSCTPTSPNGPRW